MLTVIFTVVVALAIGASGQSCSNGQIWNDCGSPCNKTCANYFDIECPAVCTPRCECPQYKVWHNGACIYEWNCDAMPTTPEPEPEATTPWDWGWNWTTAVPYKNCSGCLYDTCLDWNNTCQWGCKSGLYGDADPWGWYSDCNQECSWNCMYADCNKTYGYCLHGCVNGTDGPFCENVCPSGCDWGWGCELFNDDYEAMYSCPWDRWCSECGCQGQECVDGGWPSSAPILTLSSFISLAAFLTHMLG